jgi:hypothetical protein
MTDCLQPTVAPQNTQVGERLVTGLHIIDRDQLTRSIPDCSRQAIKEIK